MALWFVSGIVMLFVGYPKLTATEHLQSLPDLSSQQDYIDVDEALSVTGKTSSPSSIRLSSIANTPVFLFMFPEEGMAAVNANTGELIDSVSPQQALLSANQFNKTAETEYIGLVDKDAWTQSSALNPERPLHVIKLNDAAQRLIYISSHTGRIVRDATLNERRWGWLGAWLHWIYPLRSMPWWADMIIYLSLTATIMAMLGQYLGIKRWRFSSTYRSGSHSPYRSGFARWHHIAGLVFGVFLIAWIFSGMMSMRPWNLLANQSQLPISEFSAGPLAPVNSPLSISDVLARFESAHFQPTELAWHRVAGQMWLSALNIQGESQVLPLFGDNTVSTQIPFLTLKNTVNTLSPNINKQFEWLTAYDFYYYGRDEQSMYGNRTRPLPLLRVTFADNAQTWWHINPANGEVIESVDQQRRLARWLFNLLHSWDWQPLLERPWLRQILIIGFSLGGLMISISGVVMGWRRLRGTKKRKRKSA